MFAFEVFLEFRVLVGQGLFYFVSSKNNLCNKD